MPLTPGQLVGFAGAVATALTAGHKPPTADEYLAGVNKPPASTVSDAPTATAPPERPGPSWAKTYPRK